MNHEDQNDENVERLIAGIRAIEVPATPATNLLLDRVLRHLETQDTIVCRPPAAGQALRRSRNARVTTAALFVIVTIAALFLLSPSMPIAIAQVIESTTTHRLVKYKIKIVAEFKDEFKDKIIGPATAEYWMHTDLKLPRMRLERPTQKTLNDVAEQSWDEILDCGADRYLQLYRFDLILAESDTNDAMQKKLIQSILEGDEPGPHQRTAKLFRTPHRGNADEFVRLKPYSDIGKDRSFLDTLRTMQNRKDVVPSRDQVDGHDTVKYCLEEDDWTSIVWVDPSTKLPVQIQYQLVGDGAGKTFASRKWTYTDFEWDPKVNDLESLFNTQPPKGYKFENHTNDK